MKQGASVSSPPISRTNDSIYAITLLPTLTSLINRIVMAGRCEGHIMFPYESFGHYMRAMVFKNVRKQLGIKETVDGKVQDDGDSVRFL